MLFLSGLQKTVMEEISIMCFWIFCDVVQTKATTHYCLVFDKYKPVRTVQ